MSQIYKPSTSSTLPPTVPTSIITDNGTAIPAANTLTFNGVDSSDNNDNGVIVTAVPNGGSTIQTVLTNRVTGSLTTANATPTDLVTFDLGATPGLYTFKGQVNGFQPATGEGGGYFFEATYTTNGVTSNLVGGSFTSFHETAAWLASGVFVTVTDGGNNFVVNVTGIAASTINWNVLANYRKVT